MSERLTVLVNRSGGTAARAGDAIEGEVRAAFAAVDVAIDLKLLDGGAMRGAVKAHAGEARLVVGGGDGTLGCAAGVLAGTETALGILPLGTRNHLARELGVPLDLPGAAAAIAAGATRRIDVGRVEGADDGGRVFINNASVGLYPALVRLRDAEQHAYRLPKWLAAIPASVAALRRLRHHRMHLSMPGRSAEVVTPMLFVGNNRYQLDRGRLGQRAALDDGLLSVFAVASRRRRALVGFALRALVGGSRDDDFAAVGDTPALAVSGRSAHIDIAIDGEVVRLPMPLRFSIEAGALRVLAPAA